MRKLGGVHSIEECVLGFVCPLSPESLALIADQKVRARTTDTVEEDQASYLI
jgi:hypothetical protein